MSSPYDTIQDMKDRIKELEEANHKLYSRVCDLEDNANNTCKGCIFYGQKSVNGFVGNFCTNLDMFTSDAFGCINYQTKETK